MRFDFQYRYLDLYFTTATVLKRKDRHYQFFKEKPLSIPLYTEEVVWQKIEYVHRNPVQPKWRLAAKPDEYFFSSAGFYANRDRQWPFLTHFWYGDDWPEVCDL